MTAFNKHRADVTDWMNYLQSGSISSAPYFPDVSTLGTALTIAGEVIPEPRVNRNYRGGMINIAPLTFAMIAAPVSTDAREAYSAWISPTIGTAQTVTSDRTDRLNLQSPSATHSYRLRRETAKTHALSSKIFARILAEIDSSRELLSRKEDWDDEGANAFSPDTWKRAERFLITQADHAYRTLGIVIPSPNISGVADGSIDIHWKSANFELLVNVPQKNEPVSFYGDDFGAATIHGTLTSVEASPALLAFLLKNHEV